MRKFIGWIACTPFFLGMTAGVAIAQSQAHGQESATTVSGASDPRPPRESHRGTRREQRTQEHANTTRHNLHDQASTAHKVRHERHRLERNRIEGTPGTK